MGGEEVCQAHGGTVGIADGPVCPLFLNALFKSSDNAGLRPRQIRFHGVCLGFFHGGVPFCQIVCIRVWLQGGKAQENFLFPCLNDAGEKTRHVLHLSRGVYHPAFGLLLSYPQFERLADERPAQIEDEVGLQNFVLLADDRIDGAGQKGIAAQTFVGNHAVLGQRFQVRCQ